MKPKTKRVAAATIFAEYADTIVADLGEDIFVEAYNAIAAAGRESHPDRVIGRCVDCCNNFFMTSSKWAGSWYAKLAKEEATRLERTGEAFWLALKATARKRDLAQRRRAGRREAAAAGGRAPPSEGCATHGEDRRANRDACRRVAAEARRLATATICRCCSPCVAGGTRYRHRSRTSARGHSTKGNGDGRPAGLRRASHRHQRHADAPRKTTLRRRKPVGRGARNAKRRTNRESGAVEGRREATGTT